MHRARWLLLVCLALAGCSQDTLDSHRGEEPDLTPPVGQETESDPPEPDEPDAPAPSCGDGVLDEDEACDTGIAAGEGACPTSCTPLGACFIPELRGVGCASECVQNEIYAPIPGDGCCPLGAGPGDDPDCGEEPACGNGSLNPGETCDTGIAAGAYGACPTACHAGTVCGPVHLVGSGCQTRCEAALVGPVDGDGCCLGPAYAAQDDDCPALNLCRRAGQPFAVAERWEWSDAPPLLELNGQTGATPIVAQFTDDNGDGRIDTADMPDVLVLIQGVAASLPVGLPVTIALLSGDTGRHHWILDATPYNVTPFASPAAGDIDGDGLVEVIFGVTDPEMRIDTVALMALEHTGEVKWFSDPFTYSSHADAFGSPSIADLEGDGSPEIIWGNRVFDGEGHTVWQGPEPSPDDEIGTLSVAVELGGPAGMEIIDGGTAYTHTGAVLWSYSDIGYGNPSIADCEGDGVPEILLLSNRPEEEDPNVVIVEADGTLRAGPALLGNTFRPNSPAAAGDIDGDGAPEFVIAARTQLLGVRCDLSVAMSTTVADLSGASGAVLFDFDGDGAMEIVYADELQFYVFAGDGTRLYNAPRTSTTGLDTPVVADIDNDGHAEILVPQARRVMGTSKAQGVIAYASAGMPWMDAPSIWNEHAYRGLNIFEDGTVPIHEGAWWKVFNGFRANIALLPPGETCE